MRTSTPACTALVTLTLLSTFSPASRIVPCHNDLVWLCQCGSMRSVSQRRGKHTISLHPISTGTLGGKVPPPFLPPRHPVTDTGPQNFWRAATPISPVVAGGSCGDRQAPKREALERAAAMSCVADSCDGSGNHRVGTLTP